MLSEKRDAVMRGRAARRRAQVGHVIAWNCEFRGGARTSTRRRRRRRARWTDAPTRADALVCSDDVDIRASSRERERRWWAPGPRLTAAAKVASELVRSTPDGTQSRGIARPPRSPRRARDRRHLVAGNGTAGVIDRAERVVSAICAGTTRRSARRRLRIGLRSRRTRRRDWCAGRRRPRRSRVSRRTRGSVAPSRA